MSPYQPTKNLFFLLLAVGVVAIRGNDGETPPAPPGPGQTEVASGPEDAGRCVFCDTAQGFDADLEFAGIDCNRWSLVAAFAPVGEQCMVLRAAAVQFCGCPTEVEETCTLCPHGTEGFNPDQSLLFLRDLTCGDIVDMPAVDGPETCTFIDQFSYMCGCPGVVPTCSLCGLDESGNQLLMERSEEVLIPGNKEEGQHDVTCSEWDKLMSLHAEPNTPETATSRSGGTTACERALEKSEERTGVQLEGLCGCPGVEPAMECSGCPGELHLHSSKSEECSRLAFLASHITNSTKCEIVQEGAMSIDCCLEEPEEKPEEIDVGPVSSTAEAPSSGATIASSLFAGFATAMAILGFVL